MAYSGKFKPKNPEKYLGDINNIVYRSLWEKYVMKYCDNSSDVTQWGSEEIVIPYLYEIDRKYHRYFMDFVIVYKTGVTKLIEVKPFKETQTPNMKGRRTKRMLTESFTYVKNQNKWKAASEFAKDRGWKFEIWTEKELTAMGLMPKSTKPLKPYRKRNK